MAFITISNSAISCAAVIVTIIASSILSVDAIRCHQCNSHLEEDCVGLRLATPRAPLDEQYLKECDKPEMFCRKVVTKIEVSGEQRIVRGCGFMDPKLEERSNYCFEADNEGYKQMICTCFEDGCNAAPPRLGGGRNLWSVMGLSAISCMLWAAWLRQRA